LAEENSDAMNNPFLNTLKLRLLYIGIWVMITVAQISVLYYYFGILDRQIFFDSLISNVLQAVCILALWQSIRYYGNLKNIPLFLLFHFTLFLISSGIWIVSGYYITQYIILSNEVFYTPYFISLLPVRVITGLFLYIIFVLTYYLLLSRSELKTQRLNYEEKLSGITPVSVEKLTRVIVKKHSEIHCINVNQIRYIEANGDYVLIYADTGRYLKDQTMKYWETRLPDDTFVRIHRSFIVNIEAITKIELYEKEVYKVHLKTGDTLKASSAGYKLLKQKMR